MGLAEEVAFSVWSGLALVLVLILERHADQNADSTAGTRRDENEWLIGHAWCGRKGAVRREPAGLEALATIAPGA